VDQLQGQRACGVQPEGLCVVHQGQRLVSDANVTRFNTLHVVLSAAAADLQHGSVSTCSIKHIQQAVGTSHALR
jgi:hypothetical protein